MGHSERAAGAADVLDIELLPEPLGELLRDHARGDVGHPARRERHDHLDGAPG
jgi:hypothetical protein